MTYKKCCATPKQAQQKFISMKNDPALDLSSKINEVFDVPNAEEENERRRKRKEKDFEM